VSQSSKTAELITLADTRVGRCQIIRYYLCWR